MSFVLTLESHLVIDRLINSQNDTVDHLWHVTNGSDRLLLVLFWLVRSDRFQYNRIMPKRRKKNPESTVFLFGMSLGDGITLCLYETVFLLIPSPIGSPPSSLSPGHVLSLVIEREDGTHVVD